LEEIRGKPVTVLYPSLAEARKVMAALRSEEFGEGKRKNCETVFIAKSGEQIPVVMSAALIMMKPVRESARSVLAKTREISDDEN